MHKAMAQSWLEKGLRRTPVTLYVELCYTVQVDYTQCPLRDFAVFRAWGDPQRKLPRQTSMNGQKRGNALSVLLRN